MFKGPATRTVLAVCSTLAAAPLALAQPDVIVGDLTGPSFTQDLGPRKWGSIGDTTAYSFGTVSCNAGDEPLDWFGFNPNHPVIAQNMFRIRDGRIEQIGMAWVKHGICALQQDLCFECSVTTNQCISQLNPGCSDPYSAVLNGTQPELGPRSEVNATTGAFEWPFSTDGQAGDTLFKRINVKMSDLNPALNQDAVYLAEGAYVAKDDAAAMLNDNNNSYRTFFVGDLVIDGYELLWSGQTVREAPAIFAWQDHGLGLNQPDPDVHIVPIDPGTGGDDPGLMYLGYKVTQIDSDTWHYEYAVQNINSDRSLGALAITAPQGVNIENAAFNDIDYHSGEPYDDTDWGITLSSGSNTLEWRSPESFDENPDSNALRWSTLYNFWFDADAPPVAGDVSIEYFKPGDPPGAAIPALVPGLASACDADCNQDGDLNILDFICFQATFQSGDNLADCNDDGVLNILDFTCFQATFAEGCE